MNISQHLFVPRGKVLSGYYYNLSGGLVLSPQSNASTTEKQFGDVYNHFQLFGSYLPSGTWYVIRLFGRSGGEPIQGGNYAGLSTVGYVSPTLTSTPATYTSSAYTFNISNYPNGFPVVSIMWYEFPSPSLSRLTFNNTLIDAL